MTLEIRRAIRWRRTSPAHHLAAPHAEHVFTKELS
jgi:hypothetical protein